MTHEITLLPLAHIDDHILVRDRLALDEDEMRELKHSIFTGSLRQPIEVFELTEPGRYGLLSGYRRITAFRELLAEGWTEVDEIPAFIRKPREVAQFYREMVEENEIRAQLTPWERAMIAVQATDRGLFASIDEAVDGLYKFANPTKRSRIRAVGQVIEHLGEHMYHGRELSLNQCLRLSTAIRQGFAEVMDAALETLAHRNAGREWEVMRPYVEEAEAMLRERPDAPESRPGRPRRVVHLKHNLVLRRERCADGFILKFTGRGADAHLVELAMDHIEGLFGTG